MGYGPSSDGGHSGAAGNWPAAGEPAWGDPPGEELSGERDAAAWNPNASTETFPAVPDPDSDQA